MKDIINERIKRLAFAHEHLEEIAENIRELEHTQLRLEKSTYDAINMCDKTLCYAKEGSAKISEWKAKNADVLTNSDTSSEALALIQDIELIMNKLLEISYEVNEITHNMEIDITDQRDIGDNLKNSMSAISASINQAAACAELVMTLDL